jgi:hypothetical protein
MKKWLPIFISVVIITINVLSADASENILRSVNVKTLPNSYTIELTSTSPAKMTKNIVSANRIIINLRDVKVSNNLSTKYDGSAVIDNIIVEPSGFGSVNVMVQGDNIAYSDIAFKSPTKMETVEDSINSSFSSLVDMVTGSTGTNRAIQFAVLFIFLTIMIGEIKFIKSKYNELNAEKNMITKDIENTSSFKEYTPGYGKAGITKPYTTPIYGVAHNPSNIRANYLKRLKTSEATTLNMLIHNRNKESNIINQVVNKKAVFGSLSGKTINENIAMNLKMAIETTNPIEKAKYKGNLRYLDSISAMYDRNAQVADIQEKLDTLF